jgi:3-dehydroquinate dehydratase/shikimate dehydrogenase
MICIPVVSPSMEAALTDIESARAQGADLVELRLDRIGPPVDPGPLVRAAAEMRVIVTCRPEREGGSWTGDEGERLRLLRRGAEAGAAYVDLEHDAIGEYGAVGSEAIIASRHDFDGTPADLDAIWRELERLPCDVVKLATTARSVADSVRMGASLQDRKKPAIGLCMGEAGEVSRILALRWGSLLTFGSLRAGAESAPGQIPACELAGLYRVKAIDAATRLYAVAGNPIAHSMSPEIHNTAFDHLALNACYLRFRVEDFDAWMREAEPLGLAGLSVTIPHKHAALAFADEVEETARAIGAVNTLSRTPAGWEGQNTDWQAALGAIEAAAESAGIQLAGRTAMVLGAGGAGRGVAFGLKRAGCTVLIANRTPEKAEALAADLGGTAVALADAPQAARDCAVVANTTSIGMHPEVDATPLPAGALGPGQVVFDAVYNPPKTRMLREAREAGAAVADGVAMFVGQAARQFERWTGTRAPRRVMEEVVRRRLGAQG